MILLSPHKSRRPAVLMTEILLVVGFSGHTTDSAGKAINKLYLISMLITLFRTIAKSYLIMYLIFNLQKNILIYAIYRIN